MAAIRGKRKAAMFRWMMRAFPGAFAMSACALADRARWCAGPEGERLFGQVCQRFEALHRANPTYAHSLKLWGGALADRAFRLRLADAERMQAEADEKLSLALALAPLDVETLAALALVRARRAWLKPPEVAHPLLSSARELIAKALSLAPHDAHALNGWAIVLYNQVHTAPGENIDRTLADAYGKFESVYGRTGTGYLLGGWGTVRFAQADRASGSEAERLLRDAKQKYADAGARNPGGSTYNLACVCARLGQFDECRRWLEECREPGRYVIREEMATDPELAAVRSCTWFQSLFSQDCPICGLLNPPDALLCDCGYDLKATNSPEKPGWQINLAWRQKLAAYWSISWLAWVVPSLTQAFLVTSPYAVDDVAHQFPAVVLGWHLAFFGIQSVLTRRLVQKNYRSFRVGFLRDNDVPSSRFQVREAGLVYLWILGPQLALLLTSSLGVWWFGAKLPPETVRYISSLSLWLRFLVVGPYAVGLALRAKYPGFRLQAYGFRYV
jgi:hypothetical protein